MLRVSILTAVMLSASSSEASAPAVPMPGLSEFEFRVAGRAQTPAGLRDALLTFSFGNKHDVGVDVVVLEGMKAGLPERPGADGPAKLSLTGGAGRRATVIETQVGWEALSRVEGAFLAWSYWDPGSADAVLAALETFVTRGGELRYEASFTEGAAPLTATFRASKQERRALGLMLAQVARRPPVEPRRQGQENSISKVVFAEGRLWMRSDAGTILSVAPGEASLREEQLPSAALDLCVLGGKVLVACWEPKRVTVLRHDDARWASVRAFESPGHVLGLDCRDEALTLVASRKVFMERGTSGVRTVSLSRPLEARGVGAVFLEAGNLYVGSNRGEWGGGLVRVRLADGQVDTLSRPAQGQEAGLETGRDPVNAFAPSPGKPGCVVAAVGLVHFAAHGQLVEVCGDQISTLLSRPYQLTPPGPFDSGTVAFFGLARIGDSLVAAGHDGLYRVRGQAAERQDYPEFRDAGGIGVSFEVPGFALVLTSINKRHSLSGNVPLLVPMP